MGRNEILITSRRKRSIFVAVWAVMRAATFEATRGDPMLRARKGVSNVIKWMDMSKSLHGRNFADADAGRGRALGRLIFFMASDMGHFLELHCFRRWTHFLAFHRQTLRHRAKRDARRVKKVFSHYAMAIMQQRSVRRRNTLVTTFLRQRTLMFLLKVQE